jgi:hypothetical protein
MIKLIEGVSGFSKSYKIAREHYFVKPFGYFYFQRKILLISSTGLALCVPNFT